MVEHKGMTRMIRLGQMKHRTRVVRPEPLTDEQLRSITVPVLVLVGEKSEVFPPAAVKERAVSLLAHVDAEIVPGAGHALVASHPEHVIERLAGFLAAQSRSPR
jgi:pimeloyl-ACP methyl ester carboxylesterase